MAMVRKLVAVAVGAVGLVIALHLVFSAFYEDAVDVGQIWNVLNWFMAAALLVTLAVGYHRKRVLDGRSGDGVTREYLEVNVGLYVTAFLVILFAWNWFDDLTVVDGSQSDNRLLIWSVINPLFVLVACSASRALWRSGPAR